MIEGSIKKVEAGTRIANDTAEALNKIVNEIAKAAELVNGIADASSEQASGIGQINQGIMQVSEVIQTNSATSEESAAASEELSGQAQMLSELVGKFKLRKVNKSYSRLGDLDPEVLRMLEDLSDKKRTASRKTFDIEDEVPAPKVKKISLSDKEFGKY
jgi:methyl-accepting chemotaxis protein